MHKTNSPESQGNITYAVLPDGSADVWIRKNEVQLPEKDEGPQGMEADEIYFKVTVSTVTKEEISADMEVEAREQERIKYKIEQRKADEEITHATGRVLFWLHHAIVKGEHNGELEEAFENLQRAEAHKKEMDREVLAKYSID